MFKRYHQSVFCLLTVFVVGVNGAEPPQSPLEVFERRILPLLRAEKPSSCAECHLSGVDLKDYIRPSQEETFAALVREGLIDPQKPESSKLLEFIGRKPEKPSLMSDEARKLEMEAFRDWIQLASKDASLLSAKSSEPIGPAVPSEVIRHARKDRVLASFIDNVWNEMGRCAWCHSPDRNQEQVAKHGKQVSWITLADPEGTMRYLLEAGLIDPATPEESLLLLKPTLKVEHGGGQKMLVGDRTYKQFRKFIEDYAATLEGNYKTAESLPSSSDETAMVSEIWLKLEKVPANLDKKLLQVDVYQMENGSWSEMPIATADRGVFGAGQLWQHNLTLLGRKGSKWAEELREGKLPSGRYLLRIYVDQNDRLSQDFRSPFGRDDIVGEVEITSDWPAGYGKMTIVPFPEAR